ncbi:PIG-L deacetylase family protein [Corynebacterium confusum]
MALEILDDSRLERILVVVAHPDDAEYGISCAAKQWTDAGKEVAYLLVTAGEAGIRSLPPEECGLLRAEEQRRACAAVGVEDLEILDFPDGLVEASPQVRWAIAAKIRKFQPDTVAIMMYGLQARWG